MNTLWQSTHARWIIGVIGLILVAGTIEHFRDSRRDAELDSLHRSIAADSATRTVDTAVTSRAGATLDTTSRAAARTDTVWRKAAATSIAQIDTILLSATPDTVKIGELVAIDTSLISKGNALADTTQQLRAAAVAFTLDAMNERAAWATERGDLAHALQISESERRHWGLGCTSGVGLIRSGASLAAGPGVMCGVTYRW